MRHPGPTSRTGSTFYPCESISGATRLRPSLLYSVVLVDARYPLDCHIDQLPGWSKDLNDLFSGSYRLTVCIALTLHRRPLLRVVFRLLRIRAIKFQYGRRY